MKGLYIKNSEDGACLISSDFSNLFFKEKAQLSNSCVLITSNGKSHSTATSKEVAEETVAVRDGACLFTYTTTSIYSDQAPVLFASLRQTKEFVGLVYMSKSGNVWTIKILQSSTSTNAPEIYVYTDCTNATYLEGDDYGLQTRDADNNITFDSRKQPLVVREVVTSTAPSTYADGGNPPTSAKNMGSASYNLDWDLTSGSSNSTYNSTSINRNDYIFSLNSLATACISRKQTGTTTDSWTETRYEYVYHPAEYGNVTNYETVCDTDYICGNQYVTNYENVCEQVFTSNGWETQCRYKHVTNQEYICNNEIVCNREPVTRWEEIHPAWTETVTVLLYYQVSITMNSENSCLYREGFNLKDYRLNHGWIQYAGAFESTHTATSFVDSSSISDAPWFNIGSNGSLIFNRPSGSTTYYPPPYIEDSVVGGIPYKNSNVNVASRTILLAKKPITN